MDLSKFTIRRIQEGLRAREFSAVALVEAYLANIEKDERFLGVTSELALASAREVDAKLARGEELDLLDGVPCVLSDDILLAGERCTAGSKMLKDYVALYDATVVKKLKEKGAIILGKTNLREFGMGAISNLSETESLAGVVAEGRAVFALGSDSMGAVRTAAAHNGLFGLKPTYGMVSRYGLISAVSSLGSVGIVAKHKEDVAMVLKVIAGVDALDSTTVELNEKEKAVDLKDLRIGIPRDYFARQMDPLNLKLVEEAIAQYQARGAKLEEISLPHAEYALMCYHIIAAAEASAGLARYDGIRYGYTAEKADSLLEVYTKSRGEGFSGEIKKKLILGTLVLSKDYYTDYYVRAQKVRTLLQEDFKKAWAKVDVIFMPTVPALEGNISEDTLNVFTVLANLVGLPALSLPLDKIGLQVIGNMFSEDILIKIA